MAKKNLQSVEREMWKPERVRAVKLIFVLLTVSAFIIFPVLAETNGTIPSVNGTETNDTILSSNGTVVSGTIPSVNGTETNGTIPSSNGTVINGTIPSVNGTGTNGTIPSSNGTVINSTIPSVNGTGTNGTIPSSNGTVINGTIPSVNGTGTNGKIESPDLRTLAGLETLITTDTPSSDQLKPALSGDRIVWEDHRAGSDIYLYNITSGEEKSITNSQSAKSPSISGDWIVWQETHNESEDIYLFNIRTGVETRVTNDTADQVAPAVSGDRIVWEDHRNDVYAIYLYNITSGTERQISTNVTYQMNPAIYGDRIVWEDWRNENTDLYIYNIRTGEESPLIIDPAEQLTPAIYGDRVVWQDTGGNYTLGLLNLTTRSLTGVTENTTYPMLAPSIWGDWIAWQDRGEADFEIHLYSIRNGTEVLIPRGDESGRMAPAIYEDRIVWEDWSGGLADIHLFTNGSNLTPVHAGFHANVTAGDYPLTVNFTDDSSGSPATWSWNFGDGNTSREVDPEHIYQTAGIYPVALTVSTPYSRNVMNRTGYIAVGHVPSAEFDSDIHSGPNPLTIRFTDRSTGQPLNWSWDFGDNSNSTERDPVHDYASQGIYNVTLTVSNQFGNETRMKSGYITVMNSSRHPALFRFPGMTIDSEGEQNHLLLNMSEITGVNVSLINISVIRLITAEINPETIEIFSDDERGLFHAGNDTIAGNITRVRIQSRDIVMPVMSPDIGPDCFFNYSTEVVEYPLNNSITAVTWDGISPDDTVVLEPRVLQAGWSGISETAYTVRFEHENLTVIGSTTLVMAVNATWVSDHGTELGPITKRDSIKVLRIADNGTASILETKFISHDPGKNLDIFEAQSPQGLSTFTLSALGATGNLFQEVVGSVSDHLMGSTSSGGGGGSSGGGGYGGGGGVTTSQPTVTAVASVPDVETAVIAPAPSPTMPTSVTDTTDAVTSLPDVPGAGEAPVPVTGPSLFTLPLNYVLIISVVIIAIFAVVLGLRRREI